MALSDLWSLGQLRATCRRELMDQMGNKSWSWADAEINEYLGAWQDLLQERFEFTWGTATLTNVTTATVTLTDVSPDIYRLDSIWWNGLRMFGRNKSELEIMERDWRAAQPGNPEVAYQDDIYTVSFWPIPMVTAVGTSVVFEYPRRLTFVDDTTPMGVPAWTKYSAQNYVAMRALLRPGPSQDLARAAQYRARLDYQLRRYRVILDNHLPQKSPSLRLGGRYEGDINNIGKSNNLFQSWF